MPRALITQAIDESARIVLRGNTHPLIRRSVDNGIAPAGLPMQRMILVLSRSVEQESALRTLLDEQQTKGSSGYHQWLTPEEFGTEFGPADSDLAAVEAWLESHGFEVTSVARGRTAIEFSGTAGQVRDAFRTEIHSYQWNGEQHWANATDPSIPAALAPVVKGVLSLHNFARRPQSVIQGKMARMSAASPSLLPLYTFTAGTNTFYGLGPTDFATIYNVLPLWNAGVDGTGETIAIVGETNIRVSDIAAFRSLFGLPAKAPNVILNGPDPGIQPGDEPEAVLDVTWSGAVAKNATIDLVASATTNTSLGVDLSALYIVDNNLAPVMSESYGECEQTLGTANWFYNALWQQAAAQGITVVIAAGDAGSAGCDNFNSEDAASDGLAVSGFASTPYNVAVGGTDFDQTAATATQYWSATNASGTQASALGYIPETTWNQSCAGLGVSGGVSACTNGSDNIDIVAGSGGRSSYAVANDVGMPSGYPKPAWQTGPGVPQDGVRDVPDVSLFASSGFNNSFYIICEADVNFFGIVQSGFNQICSLANDTFLGIGGTSASAPAFGGIMAMVDQKTGGSQGNANYALYNLAAQNGASCNSTTAPVNGGACVFYDITKGNDAVPCDGVLDCAMAPGNGSGGYGVTVDPNNPTIPAWTTTPGYDLATGLGTVNAANLVKAWTTAIFAPTTTTLTSLAPVNVTHGQAVSVSATVAAKNGPGVPTGSIALVAAPSGASQGVGNFTLVNGAAAGSTSLLPGGAYNVTAHYPGDGTFAASDSSPVQVTVGKENSKTVPLLEGLSVTANSDWAPVTNFPYGSILELQGSVAGSAGTACGPSPEQSGVACPTGNVSFTLNGSPVNSGTYPLNSLSYVLDAVPGAAFTSLGNYTLQAQYSGDASYNSSTGTLTGTVTQAPTTVGIGSGDLNYQYVFDNGTETIYIYAFSGELFHVNVAAVTTSILQAPTGTISISEDGAPFSATQTLTSSNGIYSGVFALDAFQYAAMAATVPVTINTAGNHIFTGVYSGDAYYAGSQSTIPYIVQVMDQTFNIAPPISDVSIAAPGTAGTTSVNFTVVDSFPGAIKVTCALPSTIAGATCTPGAVTYNYAAGTATAPIAVTTTGPNGVAFNQKKGSFGFGALVCVLLFAVPIGRRRGIALMLLVLLCVADFAGCGGHGNGASPPSGTQPGTYAVNVTATSLNITRTGTFNIVVQ